MLRQPTVRGTTSTAVNMTGNGRYVGQRLNTRVDSSVNTVRETDGTRDNGRKHACTQVLAALRPRGYVQQGRRTAFSRGAAPRPADAADRGNSSNRSGNSGACPRTG
eukprot:6043454-Prymnesium_polylepis.1